jgi:AcrR family transcriptional regulator
VKEENTKEGVRGLILRTALEQFKKHGIKDVKMDDIASMLSISKRTIYELYKDKEQLLFEALKLHNEIIHDEGIQIVRNASHTLEIILKLYDKYVDIICSINKKFFADLKKYPDICKSKKHNEEQNDKKFLAWIEEGRKQGLFREDANLEIFSYILRQNLETIFTVNMNAGESVLGKFSPHELGRTLIIFYLRGISTPKGQEIIESYLKENNKINISYSYES